MKRLTNILKLQWLVLLAMPLFIQTETVQGQSEPAFVSDDFSASELDTEIWKFIDPLGDAVLTVNGAQAIISVPAGRLHDVWTGGIKAPRIMQPAQDTDFEIEVKFESALTRASQIQGVIVEQDKNNFLRFDFHSEGIQTRVFAVSFANGTPVVRNNRVIDNGAPLYMRVKREAQQWTQSYSYDGKSWVTNGSFAEVLSVTAVGAFVGNAGSRLPKHTGVIDYFFNTASPIAPEDQDQHTVTVNLIGGGAVTKDPDQPTYRLGEEIELTAVPDSGLSFYGWNGDLSGSDNRATMTITGDQIVTATFTAGDNPVVTSWYGSRQVFGQLGVPQRWVNVLGNVSDYDGIAALSYSLNAGPEVPISIGTDNNPRLVSNGDFNIEIAYTDLKDGSNKVAIQATDYLGNTTTETVNVVYVSGNTWPRTYSIDWSTVTDIQEVAQIVDGLWTLETGSIRPSVNGYDRLIAIGDVTWDDYEVTVPITIHGISYAQSRPFVGILMRWNGHYEWGSHQPRIGWWPMGAYAGYQPRDAGNNDGDLTMRGDGSIALAESPNRRLEFEVPHIFKMRVETVPGLGSLYKFKVWPEGKTEPLEWNLVSQEGFSDTQKGSFLLVAHYADASFGNVTVTPLVEVLKDIQVERGDTWANLKWTTRKPSTSSVSYGLTDTYELGSVDDSELVKKHRVTLTGLIPGARYHYQLGSKDEDGNEAKSSDLTFRTLSPTTITSDEFNSRDLNTSLWTFIDPVGDATLTMTGNQLAITVPAGVSHNAWTTGNRAPRIMQPANDTDFEVEVRFSSELSQGSQIQGILVEEDRDNFLRFDFHSDGSKTRIFAATFVDGIPSVKNNIDIPSRFPITMRVKREGDQWIQSYSYDGTSWVASASLGHILAAKSIGVFVGNAGNPAPAHTGVIDYFFNTADPFVDRTAPVISDIQVAPDDTTATITWTTDEPATSRIVYGLSDAYESGSVADSTLVTEHTITLTGLASGTLYHYQITSVDSNGNAAKSTDLTFNTNGPTTSVEVTEGVPARFELRQNYPNPFNPTTTIEFALPMPGFVSLKVFTITGEEAAELVSEELSARRYKTEWNATGFPSGVYFYRLSVKSFGPNGSFTATRKLLLLK